MPLKAVRLREGGKLYRIERQGAFYVIEHVQGEKLTRIAKIKGSYDAARETCRWHAKWSLGIK